MVFNERDHVPTQESPDFISRTVYIHGFSKTDFALWHSAITLAAGTDGNALGDQQLTKNGVPIIVDSCIAFVTQYGEWQHNKSWKKVPPLRANTLDINFIKKKKKSFFYSQNV